MASAMFSGCLLPVASAQPTSWPVPLPAPFAGRTDAAALYADPAQPVDKRIDDLIRRMTLQEKAAQLGNTVPAIERLGVPAYNYWNEALHGVARAGTATVFPQAIGNGATWDPALVRTIGDTIATEARGKYNDALRAGPWSGSQWKYFGLTFWSPNINIFRDPRWGRGQETYGEDTFLTSRMGVAFIEGLQGDDPNMLKTLACAKHYAVHSGPEPTRHVVNVDPSEVDFYDTYLPHFEAAVREARVGCVMGAYNRVYGDSASGSTLLLTDILRTRWGFDGYVVSDCDAVGDIFNTHRLTATLAEAAAIALKAGDDLDCGGSYNSLVAAVGQGLATEADVDRALHRVLAGRFRLGMFDPPEKNPYAKYTLADVDTPANQALALKAAHESIVLLKNTGVLPLDPAKLKRIAVIGPNAAARPMLLGNYNGMPSKSVTLLEGIRAAVGAGVTVTTAPGCPIVPGAAASRAMAAGGDEAGGGAGSTLPTIEEFTAALKLTPVQVAAIKPIIAMDEGGAANALRQKIKTSDSRTQGLEKIDALLTPAQRPELARLAGGPIGVPAVIEQTGPDSPDFKAAVALAREADAVIFVGGIDSSIEGEEIRGLVLDGFAGGDRTAIELPAVQTELLQALHATGKPVVFVNCSGSAMAMPWEDANLPAIVQAWYPGQAGGTAVADVLFGTYNPSGRLPVTFYRSTADLPNFEDYSMKNRTYRFFTGKPLYAFGHGLSYTKFTYGAAKVTNPAVANNGTIQVSVDVTNAGARDGDEVVQVYAHETGLTDPTRPRQNLVGFQRISLAKGQKTTVSISMPASALRHWDTAKKDYVVDAAAYELRVGAASDDIRATLPVRVNAPAAVALNR